VSAPVTDFLAMEAKYYHRCARCQCSARQTCLLSRIICIAPVVCQPASDSRIFFLRPTNGTIGLGVNFAPLSMLYQNTQRRLRWLWELAHHILCTGTPFLVSFNQRHKTSRIP
jgi:hypothetical protein